MSEFECDGQILLTKDEIRKKTMAMAPGADPVLVTQVVNGLWSWYRSDIWRRWGPEALFSSPKDLLARAPAPGHQTPDRWRQQVIGHIRGLEPVLFAGDGSHWAMLACLKQAAYAQGARPKSLNLATLMDPEFQRVPVARTTPVAIELGPQLQGNIWAETLAPISRWLRSHRGLIVYWVGTSQVPTDQVTKAILSEKPPAARYFL